MRYVVETLKNPSNIYLDNFTLLFKISTAKVISNILLLATICTKISLPQVASVAYTTISMKEAINNCYKK